MLNLQSLQIHGTGPCYSASVVASMATDFPPNETNLLADLRTSPEG